MRHVHFLRTDFFGQFGEVPDFEHAVEPPWNQNISAPAESEGVDGLLVAGELRNQMSVGQVPDQDFTVGPRRRQKPTAHAESQRHYGSFVSGHQPDVVPWGAVPQADASVAGSGGHVVRIGVELDTLQRRSL